MDGLNPKTSLHRGCEAACLVLSILAVAAAAAVFLTFTFTAAG
jgi:hypothetical protein